MKSHIRRDMKKHLPKILADAIEYDNKNLQNIIEDLGETYNGTPVIADAKKIYLEQAQLRNKSISKS